MTSRASVLIDQSFFYRNMELQRNDLIVHLENLTDMVRDTDVHVEIRQDEDGAVVFALHNRSETDIRVGVLMTLEPGRVRILHPRDCPAPVRGGGVGGEDKIKIDEIHQWLLHKFPEIREYGFEGGVIIYGRVQMGKTGLILALNWIAQYVHGTTCLLALANMKGSFHQVMGKNTVEFNRDLRGRFGDGYGLRMCDRLVGGGAPATRVFMCNPTQIRRVAGEVAGRPYILFVDEADTAVKGADETLDVSKTGPLFRALQENAVGMVEITATPFALYNQKDGPARMTIRMRPRETYRGFHETDWEMVDAKTARAIRMGSIRSAKQWINKIVCARRPLVEASGRRYMTLLLNGPTTMKRQEIIALALARSRRYDGVYVMNSDGPHLIKQAVGTELRSKDMDAVSLLYDEFETRSRREPEHRLRVYIIVAGLTASRAISFRPTSVAIGTNGLHAMLLLPSVTAHCSQLIQYMRIWGNYAEDYPRLFCATTEVTHRRIRGEVHHNLEVLAERTSEMGDCRKKIEGSVLVDTRRHDRPAVDDTHLANRTSVCHTDFDSMDEIERYLDAHLDGLSRVWMTHEQVTRVAPPPGFAYTHDRVLQRRFLNHFRQSLGVRRLHISWSDTRYQDLHNIHRRFGNQRKNYMGEAIVGDGIDSTKMYCVRWREQFCNDDLSIRDETFWSSAVFLSRTSRGKYRFYHHAHHQEKMGVLSHEV